jgi:putative protein-disulfide isomerase
MKPLLIYCYDAYCGWCYGFSPVINNIEQYFKDEIDTTVLSGGMILPPEPIPIDAMAPYIKDAYPQVEKLTGIRFGEDFLWHINNPDRSDWYMNSEKPAIAMCVFKNYFPAKAISFATDLQYALNSEGRDLTDDEAYRHLLEKYDLPVEEFYSRMKEPFFKEEAYEEFALMKQFKVTGYPSVLIQTTETRFNLVAQGFADFETVKSRIIAVIS